VYSTDFQILFNAVVIEAAKAFVSY